VKRLIIFGGHGNGTVVASTVEDINAVTPTWEILGFLNDQDEGPINGYPVLGGIDSETVGRWLDDPNVYFYWSLISVRLNHKFINRLKELGIPEERFATVVHPTAVVSKQATLGYGVSIHPLVNVGPNVTLGNHIHVFAQAMIGHGATLENFSYVANNACVGAHVRLHEGAYLGTNCTTLENVEIGRWAIVGIGSVVVRSIGDFEKAVGNPSRIIGTVE